ncbi:MAG: hypothetical protein U9M94_02680 [Patescibacteria group bacterium]|nr:hypothetical protein [Patescibacteria group bacterium]
MSYFKNRAGISILEIVIALGVFLVLVVSLASRLLGGSALMVREREFLLAGALADEGLEAVRMIARDNWNNLTYSKSEIGTSSGGWILLGENTSGQIGKFSRQISFFSVYRDNANNQVAESHAEAVLDINTKRVVANVSWEIENVEISALARETILINR